MNQILKSPLAWIPLASSLAIILMELWFVFSVGVFAEPQADEGAAAHLFQLWLVSQVVMVPLFAIKWLPRDPRQALLVLVAQIALIGAACFPVFYFNW
jgi:hypothetical protein